MDPKPCVICGKDFLPCRRTAVYCSDKCRRVVASEYAAKRYYAKHEMFRQRGRDAARQFRLSQPEKRLLSAAKDRAKRENIKFDITIDDVVIPELCPILKIPLKRLTRYAPSLDKINPSRGYVKGNVWVISKLANTMKNDATKDELKRFGEWLKTL